MAENKRVTGDYTITTIGGSSSFNVNTNDTNINSNVVISGDLVVLGKFDYGTNKNRIYVSKNGNDSNDGRTWETAKLTIKNACQTAQLLLNNPPADPEEVLDPQHITIFVASGDYSEVTPITVPGGCAIIGDNLRSVTVRPASGLETNNVFLLNSNCYVWGLTVRGHRLKPSALDITPEGYAGYNGQGLPRNTAQTGFAFSFAPGSVIRVSPYIQNCSSISGSGVFGSEDYVPGGGGILVDPSVCAEGNRINSIVLDAFTQINQGGIGCKVLGRGYMQLVSFFVNFCQFGVLCVDGGHVTLLNSNCSFGNYAFWSEGLRTLVREPDAIDATNPSVIFQEVTPFDTARQYLLNNRDNYQDEMISWVNSVYATGCTATDAASDLITTGNVSWMREGQPVVFTGSVFGGINTNTEYYVRDIDTLNKQFKVSTSILGPAVDLSTASGLMEVKLSYDPGVWKRYIGIIIDALIQDLVTESVIYTRRAAGAFWDGNSSILGAAKTEFVEVIDYLYGEINTDLSGDAALTHLGFSFDNWKEFVENGANKPFESARNIIENNLTTYITNALVGVDLQYTDKCTRDLTYIADAVISDLITGTTRASRTAGNAYYYGTVDIPIPTPSLTIPSDQKTPTVNVINAFANELITGITGSRGNDALVKFFAIITDIVSNGPDPDDLLPGPVYEDARRLLSINKRFIKEEAVAYVNNETNLSTKCLSVNGGTDVITCVNTGILAVNMPIRFVGTTIDANITANTVYYVKEITSTTTFTISNTPNGSILDLAGTPDINMFCIKYDQTKCQRDTGYLLDAVISDLATNSQESTIAAGNAYWSGAVAISNEFVTQIQATIDTIDYIKRLSLRVINSDITPPIGRVENVRPQDVFVGDSGDSLYLLSELGPKVLEYSLATPYLASSLKYVSSYDLRLQDQYPTGLTFSATGNFMFVVGVGDPAVAGDGSVVYRYSLGTSWRISSASYAGNNLDVSSVMTRISGLVFNSDGSQLALVGATDTLSSVYVVYDLGTNYDLSTAVYNTVVDLTTRDVTATGITTNASGSKLYISGATTDNVYEFRLSTPNDFSSAITSEVNFSVIGIESEITGVYLNTSANRLYIIGETSDSVSEFKLTVTDLVTSAELLASTRVGYYSTPYNDISSVQDFFATVTATTASTNRFTCNTTFYLRVNQAVKFIRANFTDALIGGVNANDVYYIREIIDGTTFTVSTSIGGEIFSLTDGSGDMAVAPNDVSSVGAAYEIEKNFNTIIEIIRDGERELEQEFGSLIEATGYTLSYAGAGIDYSKLSPGQGGTGAADPNKYTIELSGGRVYITATDEKGDFYVGKVTPVSAGEASRPPRPLFRINQSTGAIDGRAFYQSIFGFMAPFILALTRRK